MRRGFTRYGLLFVLFFCGYFGNAQVKTSIDTTQIRIGEEIQYSIEVEADTTALVLFPEGQSFLPLEVIESYKTDTSYTNSKFRLIKRYGLTQFDSGAYTLPAQRIIIDDRPYMTDSVRVEVADVPVDTLKQKMFDIKPVIEVDSPPFNFLKLLYWLLPILLIGALIFFYFRRKKKKEEKEKRLPPYEEAMEALQELDSLELLKENKSKAYYSSLTEIVKRYIDREVDDTALESTSDELIERLQLHKDAGHFEFDTLTIKKLDAILKRADLVKFAKVQQEMGQARADRSSIEEIINETKEAIPEPTEEELLQDELFAEEIRKKRRVQKRKKRIALAVSVALTVILANGAIQGFDTMRDAIFGNELKSMAEGRWYKSEYGNPALIIETPEILKRKDSELPQESQQVVDAYDTFSYGNLTEKFYVLANTAIYKEGLEIDMDRAAEIFLSSLEERGANNMIVKQEVFQIEENVDGKKYHGQFDFDTKVRNKILKMDYELLLFNQGQSLQLLLVAHLQEDVFANEIKTRIVNSIELEVQQSNRGE
ncbi:MAG: DUF4381 family protein [Flavobacteriaceae bacterium]|nr:DUF4381 family protein [Flavobacteriaceae bacterium]